MEWHKPALLIYRDGRIWPNNTVYEKSWVTLVERIGPTFSEPLQEALVERTFCFMGVAGPYAIYREMP